MSVRESLQQCHFEIYPISIEKHENLEWSFGDHPRIRACKLNPNRHLVSISITIPVNAYILEYLKEHQRSGIAAGLEVYEINIPPPRMINLGLVRITKLLTQLSTPTWKAIHIAGTNGKGSIAAYLSSLFIRLAKVNSNASSSSDDIVRIGRFTSPHLIDRWDCITINDQPVSKSQFLSVENHVKSAAQRIESQFNDTGTECEAADGQVTEFELLTATAFELFTQQKCQVAVIECGLGGRLDATNVLETYNVVVSVIARIGLDHQNLLGDTVELIAREKAGIIKQYVPVVMDGMNSTSVKAVVAEAAKDNDAQIWYSDNSEGNHNNSSEAASDNNVVDNAGGDTVDPDQVMSSSPIPTTIPSHQRQNLNLALLAFSKAVPRIPSLKVTLPPTTSGKDIITLLLRDVSKSYQGRLQHLHITNIVPEYRDEILLDGAHNAQSAKVLRDYIDNYLFQKQQEKSHPATVMTTQTPTSKAALRSNSSSVSNPHTDTTSPSISSPIIWIIAMSRGKPAQEIFEILLQNRRNDKVIVTNFSPVDGMPWVKNESTSELARIARMVVKDNHHSIIESEDIIHALKTACQYASQPKSDTDESSSRVDDRSPRRPQIVVAGSLYLVSDLLRIRREGLESSAQ